MKNTNRKLARKRQEGPSGKTGRKLKNSFTERPLLIITSGTCSKVVRSLILTKNLLCLKTILISKLWNVTLKKELRGDVRLLNWLSN